MDEQRVKADAFDGSTGALGAVGFDIEGHRADHAWASWPGRDCRTAVVHVMEFGSRRWSDRLEFRDVLRSDPELRAAYLSLKLTAAEQSHSWSDYTAKKTDFVSQCLSRGLNRSDVAP